MNSASDIPLESPNCKGKNIREIINGLILEPFGDQEAEFSGIDLGGGCVSDDNLMWVCGFCRHEWGRQVN